MGMPITSFLIFIFFSFFTSNPLHKFCWPFHQNMFCDHLSPPSTSALKVKSPPSLAQKTTPASWRVSCLASLPSVLNKVTSLTLWRHPLQLILPWLKTLPRQLPSMCARPKILTQSKRPQWPWPMISLPTTLSPDPCTAATLSFFLFISHTRKSSTFHLCGLEYLSPGIHTLLSIHSLLCSRVSSTEQSSWPHNPHPTFRISSNYAVFLHKMLPLLDNMLISLCV